MLEVVEPREEGRGDATVRVGVDGGAGIDHQASPVISGLQHDEEGVLLPRLPMLVPPSRYVAVSPTAEHLVAPP